MTTCMNCGLQIEPLPRTDLWMHDDQRRPHSPHGWVCDPTKDRSTHTEPEGDGERCEDCGTGYSLVWWAPAPLWTQTTDRPHSSAGMFCLECFTKRAADRGFLLKWIPEVMSDVKEETDA